MSRERIEESKNVQATPTRTHCKRSGPLPYCIQIVGRPGTGNLPSTIAPPDHPQVVFRAFQVNTRNMWALIVTDLNETMKFVKRANNCVLKVHFVFFFIFLRGSMGTTSESAFEKNRYLSSCNKYIKALRYLVGCFWA